MEGENEIMSFESDAVNMDIFIEIFNKNLPIGLKPTYKQAVNKYSI